MFVILFEISKETQKIKNLLGACKGNTILTNFLCFIEIKI